MKKGNLRPNVVFQTKVHVFFKFQAAAAFAADAVARMSGTVGVVAVTAGPGLTNAVTAIKNAQMAQSPVLLIGEILLLYNKEK